MKLRIREHPELYVPPYSDLVPGGYRRSEYHRYGASNGAIEFWGLDQPGARPPDVAWWVAMDLLDQMDADGDGRVEVPIDGP